MQRPMTIASPGVNATQLDHSSINTIRFLSVDAVQKANSGHPGLPLGAAPMAYILWTRFFQHNPTNPRWFNRDRFVLSAGHGSMLLYSLLHLTGYDLPLEEIRQFRQWGSRTPGHPERGFGFGGRAVHLTVRRSIEGSGGTSEPPVSATPGGFAMWNITRPASISTWEQAMDRC